MRPKYRQLPPPDLVIFSGNLEVDFTNTKPYALTVRYGDAEYKLRPGDRMYTGAIMGTRFVSVGDSGGARI